MKVRVKHRHALAGVFLATAAVLHYPASAAIVGTEDAAGSPAREHLGALASRPDVMKQLQDMGVSPEEARARVDAMTEEELQAIAGKLSSLPAGGAMTNTELLVIVLLIVLLLIVI